jgi:TP901 family phage tail tape measure protein
MALDTELKIKLNSREAEQEILRITNKSYGINLNINSQPLGRITGQLSEFNKSMDAANARVVAFGASAGAIAVLEKSFHALIDSTIEVQKALNGIQVILGASDGLMSKFGKNLFDIAKNTGQSFEVVAEAATNLSRQGLGVEETLKRTNDALILSRITGMGAAESVRSLTAAVNSFASQAVTASEVVNKFATVDSSFAIGAKDLPEAISRVGSAAAQAGVSLDELIALVTSAQVATARGGSVIGNSFKTIFTRLERGKTQDLLESLGISTKDSEGKLKSTMDMLKDLAKVYNNLSQGQQANVAEKVGGVFQINILKAALSDLSKEHSVYNAALQTSMGSSDEAAKRNEKLNETYAAQINRLQQSATQLAANAGQRVFGPSMSRVLGAGNGILDSLNNVDSSSIGAKLGKGILDGIGQVLSGPGLVLIGGVIIKLLGDFSKFAGGSVKELLGLNGVSKEQAAIQASITKLLEKNPSLLAQINSEAKTQNEQAKILLDFYSKQTAEMQKQATLTAEIASKLYKGGLRMGGEGVPVTKKASGYIPEFASEEAQARMLGAKSPRAMWSSGTIGGQKFIKNSEEREIVGYGANGDSAVIPMYAAAGYIPNFASPREAERARQELDNLISGKSTSLIGMKNLLSPADRLLVDWRRKTELGTSDNAISKALRAVDITERDKYLAWAKTNHNSETVEAELQKTIANKQKLNSIEDIEVSGKGGNKVVNLGNLDLSSLDSSIANKYGIFFPNSGGSALSISQSASDISLLKNKNVRGNVSASLKTASVFPLNSKENDFDKILEELFLPPFRNLSGRIASTFLSKDSSIAGEVGVDSVFTPSVKGTIFEKALGAASVISRKKFEKDSQEDQRPFDYAPLGEYPALMDKIGLSSSGAAEAKKSKEAAHNLPSKILTYDSGLLVKLQNKIKEKLEPKIKTAAAGYIPFSPELHSSIDNELAAGARPDQIRVEKYSQLINSNNPLGLGTFSDKYEPHGKVDDLAAMKKKGYAAGYIPNFADDDSSGSGAVAGGVTAIADLAFAMTMLKGASGEATKGLKQTASIGEKVKAGWSDFKTGGGITNAAIFAPLITSQIASLIPNKGISTAVSSMGQVASTAGTGAMLGSMFGPEGTVIGGAIGLAAGAFMELPTVIHGFTSNLPELTKKAEDAKDSFVKISSATKGYLSISDQLKTARQEGNTALENKLTGQLQSEFSNFNAEQRQRIIEGTAGGNLEEVMGKILEETKKTADQTENLKQIEEIKNKISIFSGELDQKEIDKAINILTKEAVAGKSSKELRDIQGNVEKAGGWKMGLEYDDLKRMPSLLKAQFPGANQEELDKLNEMIQNNPNIRQGVMSAGGKAGTQITKTATDIDAQAVATKKSNDAIAVSTSNILSWIAAIKSLSDVSYAQIDITNRLTLQQQEFGAKMSEQSRNAYSKILEKYFEPSNEVDEAKKRIDVQNATSQYNTGVKQDVTAFIGDFAKMAKEISDKTTETNKSKSPSPADLFDAKNIGKTNQFSAEVNEAANKANTKFGQDTLKETTDVYGSIQQGLLSKREDIEKALEKNDIEGLKGIMSEQVSSTERSLGIQDQHVQLTKVTNDLLLQLVDKTGEKKFGFQNQTLKEIDEKYKEQQQDRAFETIKNAFGGIGGTTMAGQTETSGVISRMVMLAESEAKLQKQREGLKNISGSRMVNRRTGVSLSQSRDEEIAETQMETKKTLQTLVPNIGYKESEDDLVKAKVAQLTKLFSALDQQISKTTNKGEKTLLQTRETDIQKALQQALQNSGQKNENGDKLGQSSDRKIIIEEIARLEAQMKTGSVKDLNMLKNDSALDTNTSAINTLTQQLKSFIIPAPQSNTAVQSSASTPARKAVGHIPEMIAEEHTAKMLGATNPKAMFGKGTIGGKRFIMNSEEHEIPRFGKNGDSAVIPMYANGKLPSIDIDLTKQKTRWGTYYNPDKSGLGASGKFSGLNFATEEMDDLGYNLNYTKDIKINKDLMRLGADVNKFPIAKIFNYTVAELRRYVIAHEAHHASSDAKAHPILQELYHNSETAANFKGGFAARKGENILQKIGSGISAVSDYWNNHRALDHYLEAKEDRFKNVRGHLSRMSGPYANEAYNLKKPLSDTEKKLFNYVGMKWAQFNANGKNGFIRRDAKLITSLEQSAGKILSGKAITGFVGGATRGAGVAALDALGVLGSMPAQILSGATTMGDATSQGMAERETAAQRQRDEEKIIDQITNKKSNDKARSQEALYNVIHEALTKNSEKTSEMITRHAEGYVPNTPSIVISPPKSNIIAPTPSISISGLSREFFRKKDDETTKEYRDRTGYNGPLMDGIPASEYWKDHGGKPSEKVKKQAQDFNSDIPETNAQKLRKSGYKGSIIEDEKAEDYWAKHPKTSTANMILEVTQGANKGQKIMYWGDGASAPEKYAPVKNRYAEEYKRREREYLGRYKENAPPDMPQTSYAQRYKQSEAEYLGRYRQNYASGYVPDAIMEIRAAKRLGAMNPVAMISDGTIDGKRFIKNSEEIEIPRYGQNGDSAVIPKYAGGNMPAAASSSSSNVNVPVSLNINISANNKGSAASGHQQEDSLHRNVNAIIPELKANIEKVVKETFERRINSLEGRMDRVSMTNQAAKPIPVGIDKSSIS